MSRVPSPVSWCTIRSYSRILFTIGFFLQVDSLPDLLAADVTIAQANQNLSTQLGFMGVGQINGSHEPDGALCGLERRSHVCFHYDLVGDAMPFSGIGSMYLPRQDTREGGVFAGTGYIFMLEPPSGWELFTQEGGAHRLSGIVLPKGVSPDQPFPRMVIFADQKSDTPANTLPEYIQDVLNPQTRWLAGYVMIQSDIAAATRTLSRQIDATRVAFRLLENPDKGKTIVLVFTEQTQLYFTLALEARDDVVSTTLAFFLDFLSRHLYATVEATAAK